MKNKTVYIVNLDPYHSIEVFEYYINADIFLRNYAFPDLEYSDKECVYNDKANRHYYVQ